MRSISLRLAVIGGLIARHCRVWRHAWRARKSLDGPGRTREEAAFLPAALALAETPVSPAPRGTMWLLSALAALTLGWAIVGKIDIVATAQGKVVPDDRTKMIQPLETAKVAAIHVQDGQQVRVGDLLVELDPTAAHADHLRLQTERDTARLQAARGQAMVAALATQTLPSLARPDSLADAAFAEAERLLDGHFAEFDARRTRLRADLSRREAERQSTLALVRKLEQTVPLAQQRASDFKDLVARNFVSRHGYYEREQARIEQEGDLAAQRSRLDEIDAAIAESRSQLAALTAETRRTHLDSIHDAQQKVATLDQELRKAEMRAALTRLTAPVDGAIQQLAVHTVGGVVTEAQPLMLMVPRDKPVEIEALLENKDIGFVMAGQRATVKVETFLFTKYGTLEGTVASVSDDAIQDEKRGLVYAARIRLEKSEMDIDGRTVRLSPGMAVTVEVKTGKRRVIEYFLSPLMVHGAESLRER